MKLMTWHHPYNVTDLGEGVEEGDAGGQQQEGGTRRLEKGEQGWVGGEREGRGNAKEDEQAQHNTATFLSRVHQHNAGAPWATLRW